MGGQRFRILYVGPLANGQTCLQRMKALEDLGNTIVPVNTLPPQVVSLEDRFIFRLKNYICGPMDVLGVNEEIIRAADEEHPDIVWVDKGLIVKRETLLNAKGACPGVVAVAYSPDDMMNPRNQTREYVKCIPVYDLHVTTKSYNVRELRSRGARDVLFVDNGYCPSAHRPINISPEDKALWGGKVGFIGHYERDRARSLMFLSRNDIDVRVWGRWRKKRFRKYPNLQIMGRSLWGDDYARAICAFDINLCFLRKVNRDLQTTRSIEIPACGAFMVAERTGEHLRLFEEGVEAEFFSSDEELVDKVRYYLEHEEQRKRIAAAGRQRCLTRGYSNRHRLQGALDYICREDFRARVGS